MVVGDRSSMVGGGDGELRRRENELNISILITCLTFELADISVALKD